MFSIFYSEDVMAALHTSWLSIYFLIYPQKTYVLDTLCTYNICLRDEVSKKFQYTVFYLITAHAPISAHSSN